MARAALYFGLTPSIFSCIPVGLTKHVHEYRIGSRSCWEPLMLGSFLLEAAISSQLGHASQTYSR